MRLKAIALVVAAMSLVAGGATQGTPTRAETGLVGVKLFDTGIRLIGLYGTPNEIQAVAIGGGAGIGAGGGAPAGGPPGGFGGRGGFPAAGGPPAGAAGRGAGARGGAPMGIDLNNGFDFGDTILQSTDALRQSVPQIEGASQVGGPSTQRPPAGPPAGMGFPGAPGGRAPGGGATENAEYTRWVYNRSGSRYGFILNKYNQVVQIEAVGISDAKVKTRQGVGFGVSFGNVMTKYGNPDGYDISSDTLVVRYLKNDKVAFRFNKLKRNGNYEVTGVVVSAGKV